MKIRRINDRDIDALYRVYSDPLGCKWVGDGLPITKEACERWVVVTQNNYKQRGYGMFAVELIEDTQSQGDRGRAIGFCGLVHPGGQEVAEIKYALNRSLWGQGFGVELAGAMLTYALDRLDIDRVIATIAPQNAASIRIVERIGMTRTDPRQEDDGSVTEVYEITSNARLI